MKSAQFQTELHDGILRVPSSVPSALNGVVHVFLWKPEDAVEADIIDELIDSPIEDEAFKPLTRVEANER